MAKIGIISCSKSKFDHPAKAENFYSPSALFSLSLKYCKHHYDVVYILSAKYGLLKLDDVVAPYELTLKGMPVKQRKMWAQKVMLKMAGCVNSNDHIYWHCGVRYREFLMPLFKCEQSVPLKGLKNGRQMQYYKECGFNVNQ